MFYWKDSSESVEQMSKCDILRGIVTEKLSTALQEILAVLQRTVSGYEEEASGLRREISQQNIQLELLKPRINLQRRGGAWRNLYITYNLCMQQQSSFPEVHLTRDHYGGVI